MRGDLSGRQKQKEAGIGGHSGTRTGDWREILGLVDRQAGRCFESRLGAFGG